MSGIFRSVRDGAVVGGAVDEGAASPSRSGRATGAVFAVLLVYLAAVSPWTFVFVVGLLVSVLLHEIGHFVTARRTGMLVTQFFMGFGPRVFSVTRGETEYGVRALPLGAFVRIVGMNNLDDVGTADEQRAYRSKSYPRRMLVITAGSVMHMVISFGLLAGTYMTAGGTRHTGRAVVSYVAPGTPAASVGIEPGDVLESVDGDRVGAYATIVAAITRNAPGTRVKVAFSRGGRTVVREATLAANPDGRAFLGLAADDLATARLGPVEAATRTSGDIARTVADSARGVLTVLNPVNSYRQITDPEAPLESRPSTVVGVSRVGGEVGRHEGIAGVLRLLAYVNVFVGVFNMFPLLPFDGGHAAIATYERLRSRRGRSYRADAGKMVPVAAAVVGLLVVLLVTGLYLDLARPVG